MSSLGSAWLLIILGYVADAVPLSSLSDHRDTQSLHLRVLLLVMIC